MRSDLRPETIEALLDLIEPEESASVDDASLTRLALGIADSETRQACARAMLASGETRARLARIRARLAKDLSGGAEVIDVPRLLALAREIERILAEGRWGEGTDRLRTGLPEFRRAWRAASDAGDHAAVESFVRSLLQPLVEMGEWAALAALAGAGHRAADALGAKLRRYLLAYEGVAASKRGQSAEAIRLWTERLRLAREEGNRAVEADALTDLASQALSDGDAAACRALLPQAMATLDGLGRPDLEAGLDVVRAGERRLEGDLARSAEHARRALSRVSVRMGADPSAFVRIRAGEALAACGERREAIALWADALGIAVDAGLSAHASESLRMLGEALESEGAYHLALACLDLAWAIDSARGTPRAGRSGPMRAEARARHPGVEPWDVDGEAWTGPALEILGALRDGLSAPATA